MLSVLYRPHYLTSLIIVIAQGYKINITEIPILHFLSATLQPSLQLPTLNNTTFSH